MEATIITYQPQYQPYFHALNKAWITQWSTLEAEDEEFLNDPQRYIIAPGGEVFVALLGKEVAGVCGIVKMDDSTYELVRMAVHPQHRRNGIGKKLALTCIEWAGKQGAKTVLIETGANLPGAVPLYTQLGFEHHIPEAKHRSKLARADVFMRLDIRQTEVSNGNIV